MESGYKAIFGSARRF